VSFGFLDPYGQPAGPIVQEDDQMAAFGYGRHRDYAAVLAALTRIEQQIGQIMTAQDDINTATTAITSLLADVSAQVTQLGADLTAIQAELASGQPVNTTALDSAVQQVTATQAALDSAVASITGLAPVTPPAGG
jgi:multidrug efflux pump subunit AcrA (membrane-fusion protein)